MQFVNLQFGLFQSPPSRCGDPVYPSPSTRDVLQLRLQQAAALHSVQQWVQRPRSNEIAMVLQLLHHRQSKYRLVSSVHEHVDANETVKKLPPMW